MVGHGGSSAGSYLADPTSPIPSHCASIVMTSTLRLNSVSFPLQVLALCLLCLMSIHHTINRAAFVCLSVCLFVPYLLRGPLTDLRQTWWVYVGGPRNCP